MDGIIRNPNIAFENLVDTELWGLLHTHKHHLGNIESIPHIET